MNDLYTSVYIEMAEAKIAEGDTAGAEALYRSALAKDPNEVDALVGYARLLTARPQQHTLAEALLQRARGLCPTSARLHVALADLYDAMGRHAQARSEFTEAERSDPSHPDVLKHARHHKPATGGLFGRLKQQITGSLSGGGDHHPHAPAPHASSPVSRAHDCPYCGNHRRPGTRVCGRCGATLNR